MALTRMLIQIVDDGSGKKIKKKLTVRDAEEIRKLYSESFKGERNPMYGSKRGNPRFGLKGKDAPHYGHPQPQKAKDAISKANKGRLLGEKSPWYGVKMYGSTNHNAKRVQAPDGTIYGSMVECAAAYGVTKGIMQRWVTKCPEKGFKYLPKEPKKK